MSLSTYEGIDLVHSGTVTSTKRIEETQTMYNLTVDTAHTFFVGEGEWLVHNTPFHCLPGTVELPNSQVGPKFGRHGFKPTPTERARP